MDDVKEVRQFVKNLSNQKGWSKKFQSLMLRVYERDLAYREETGSISSIWMGNFITEERDGVFINPMNKVMKWGRYSYDEFERGYLELEAPVVKEGVDKEFAMWYGADGKHALINYGHHHFNFYPRDYERIPFYGNTGPTRFGDILRTETTLSYDIIREVEAYVKFEFYDLYRIRDFGDKKFSFLQHEGRIDPRTELFNFFIVLAHLGFGYFGAVNTPEERSNFSWWREILEFEALFEYERDNGLLKEEWFLNGTT